MTKIDKIEELQNILKEDQTNFQARRQLAVLLLDLGYPEEAKQHFLYLSKIFTDDSGIFYNLGITYEKLKDLDKAISAYNKAIELAPEKIDAYYNLGLVFIDKKDTKTQLIVSKPFYRKITTIQMLIFQSDFATLRKGNLTVRSIISNELSNLMMKTFMHISTLAIF